jgi:hypothetical protein
LLDIFGAIHTIVDRRKKHKFLNPGRRRISAAFGGNQTCSTGVFMKTPVPDLSVRPTAALGTPVDATLAGPLFPTILEQGNDQPNDRRRDQNGRDEQCQLNRPNNQREHTASMVCV